MIEVEAKVRLTPAERRHLEKVLPRIARYQGKKIKKDRYYGKEKAFYMRTRQENEKTFFNLKRKNLKRGMELNEEIELELNAPEGFDQLLKACGFHRTASKVKSTLPYRLKKATIELHRVKGLDDFLEIELLVPSKLHIPAAKKELQELFRQLGFSPARLEKKYYLELLQKKRRKK